MIHSPPAVRRTTRQTSTSSEKLARDAASALLSGSASQGGLAGRSDPKVKKLDPNAYKPFGTRSRSSSIDAGEDTVFCKGGPGKQTCGEPVTNTDKGVECELCQNWYHAGCQEIPIPAYDALAQFGTHLCWLCPECKDLLKEGQAKRLLSLESKVVMLDRSMKEHVKLVAQSMKEQELAADRQTKLIERSVSELHAQKASYADIVKGTCSEMYEKVSAKLPSVPEHLPSSLEPSSMKGMAKVLDDFMDKDRRKNNIVIHNLPEMTSGSHIERTSHDTKLFQDMVKEAFNIRAAVAKSFRVGKSVPNRDRLLIVTLETPGVKWDLLRLASQLRNFENWSNIYLTPDLTPAEREAAKKVRDELASRRRAGETNLTIRRGKIVTSDVSTQPRPRSTSEQGPNTLGGGRSQAPGSQSHPANSSQLSASSEQAPSVSSGANPTRQLADHRPANESAGRD